MLKRSRYFHQNFFGQPFLDGFSMLEMILAIAVVVVLSGAGVFYFGNSYRSNVLNGAAEEIMFLARLAQQEAISQKDSNNWGIRFDNSSPNNAFVAVFSGTYSAANSREYYSLPNQLEFVFPSTGTSSEVLFYKMSGASNSSTTISLKVKGGSTVSKNLSINLVGGISLD